MRYANLAAYGDRVAPSGESGVTASVIDVIASWWLACALLFGVSVLFGFLAHRSPKSDWEYLKHGPVLWGAFVTLLFVPFVKDEARYQAEMDNYWAKSLACLKDPYDDPGEQEACRENFDRHVEKPRHAAQFDTLGEFIDKMTVLYGNEGFWTLVNLPVEATGVFAGRFLAGARRPKEWVIRSDAHPRLRRGRVARFGAEAHRRPGRRQPP